METSIATKKKMKLYESLHDGDLSKIGLQPKMDCAGIWTEGWGHAIRDDKGNFIKGSANKDLAYKFSKIHSIAEADFFFEKDIDPVELAVIRKLTFTPTQNQFDALVCFVFNCGISSTLFAMINAKESEVKISSWWKTHYIISDGKEYPGLKIRRKEESELFFKK